MSAVQMSKVIAALRESRCYECSEPWDYDEGRCDHRVSCSFAEENVPGRVFGRTLREQDAGYERLLDERDEGDRLRQERKDEPARRVRG